MLRSLLAVAALLTASLAAAITPEDLAQQQSLLQSMEVKAGQLRPLHLNTVLVAEGQAQAVICVPADPAWKPAAEAIQKAIAEATGVTLTVVADTALAPEEFLKSQDVLLLGHLDNNRHLARLYHNFFVCSDQGYTGRTGYELRSVHDPFGTGHNALAVGSSFPEGAARGAAALAALVKASGKPGALTLGRVLDLKFDDQDRGSKGPSSVPADTVAGLVAQYRTTMLSPGQGRGGVSGLVMYGLNYHRSGNPGAGQVYKGLMAALLEYYRTDKVINEQGMARYDNDFRDAWTFQVAILWDLLEESGLFSDQERLDYTNLLIRLGLECVLYQGYDRPSTQEKWRKNTHIVHNHNTFPGLGILFVGRYIQRHYGAKWTAGWIETADGIFRGVKHTSKPMEDAAGYQWLVPMHCAIYSLSSDDMVYFTEGHLRRTALDALQVMDNAGYQVAFGDHSDETGASALADMMQLAAWYYRDPQLLWGTTRATSAPSHPLGQMYYTALTPEPPLDQVGVVVSPLPRLNYDDCATGAQYATAPNVPFAQTFNKLSLRAGWDKLDEYLLLDGFGRGNHMHFDANAILRYARGGVPLLVDGEYIKNLPKYHNSLVIIRNGQAELAPAVTRLDRAERLDSLGVSRTSLVQYNGADWTRTLLWRPNGYVLVVDDVTAREAGDYTLRCCWRPWGEAKLTGPTLTVDQPPMRLTISNADGAAGRLETLKLVGALAVSRYSQQIGVKLASGQSYRFLNLVHAEPVKAARDLPLRPVASGVSVIGAGAQAEAVLLPGAGPQVQGLKVAAEVAVLSPDRLALAGATGLADGAAILTASAPVSLELNPAGATGVLIAATETEVKLRLSPGNALKVGTQAVTADGQGLAAFKVGPGRHPLTFAAFPLYPAVAAARAKLCALPEQAVAAGGGATVAAKPRWSVPGFDPQPLPLPVASVTTPATNLGKGPIEKLTDGMYQSSTNSVMWPAGQPAVATIELVTPGEVKSVVLREWHMVPGWDVADRKLEVSSDGFRQDIRVVPGPFVETGKEVMGTNVNTIYELPVGQQVRQLRLTWTPARPDATVYVADVEVRGLRTGQSPLVTALAAGDLTGDGRPETLAASEGGEVRALDETGKVLWTYSGALKGRINSLACADVTGDGKAEVMVGGNGQVLSLLSPDGKLLWTVSPPRFRGIASDVITVFPADVTGDKRPEIICGTLNWQYFAYDAAGQMLWSHVIYAHSATVGCAADLDADGKDEIVAGCAYYTLNVIDHDGSRLWRGSPVGPEMTAVAAADVTGDGKPEVFTGVDGGELYAFSPTGDKLWQLNLGDKVTRMLPLDVNGDGKQELVCAAESACVFAVDGAGKIVWRTTLPDGCGDMALRRAADGKPELVVSAGAAGLVTLRPDGTLAARYPVGRAGLMVAAPGRDVFVTREDGSVAAVDVK